METMYAAYQHGTSLRALQVLGQLDTQSLLQTRHHGNTAPWGSEVDLDGVSLWAVGVVLDLVRALFIKTTTTRG